MKHKDRFISIFAALLICTVSTVLADDTEIAGVKFSSEKTVAGQTLKLNGVAVRKALMVVKVFAGGFYLEKPTQDATGSDRIRTGETSLSALPDQ